MTNTKRSLLSRRLIIGAAVFSFASIAAAAEPTMQEKYVFTDGKAKIVIPGQEGEVAYSIKTITQQGWGPTADGKLKLVNGEVELKPLEEGIHIVSLQLDTPTEVRFLAIAPPPAVDAAVVAGVLPHAGKKLFAGETVTVLAMGDSVTNTGDYESMLVLMLKRATGNQKITFVDRSYPGRSVDASVREFARDAGPNHPDVGLLMYGVNDIRGGCLLETFLEQYRWIAEKLSSDCNADTVFLTPTPDLPTDVDSENELPTHVVLTWSFAERLFPLGQQMKVPVADTFSAIWGTGSQPFDVKGQHMWPRYGLGYDRPFTSMLESDGKGDGTHPNALGHLAIAKAVFNTMMGVPAVAAPLSLTGESRWTPAGLVSHVIVRNNSTARREGTLTLSGPPEAQFKVNRPTTYALDAGESTTFDVSWTGLVKPEYLLKYPYNAYFAPYYPSITAVDAALGGSRIYAVQAPMAVMAAITRQRLVITGQTVPLELVQPDGRQTITVAIPADAEVGRIPVVKEVKQNGAVGWAVAEVTFARFGAALSGEATADGDLAEWKQQRWVPVGEGFQARWTAGMIDHRATPAECYSNWAFRAGAKGLYLAAKVTGKVANDHFIVYFDPRSPELLGTPGTYYWVGGALADNGTLKLDAGDTSKRSASLSAAMKGAWRAADDGVTLEMFVPYELMDCNAWPAAGDLGLSLWWTHAGEAGKPGTNIFWAEDGHPWSTRWYGVVRRDDGTGKPLPYRVRIK